MNRPLLRQILDEHFELGFAELVRYCGLPHAHLLELVQFGVIEPLAASRSGGEAAWRFTGRALALARRAARLQSGFELDAPALALAVQLFERIDALERRVRELECQLPG